MSYCHFRRFLFSWDPVLGSSIPPGHGLPEWWEGEGSAAHLPFALLRVPLLAQPQVCWLRCAPPLRPQVEKWVVVAFLAQPSTLTLFSSHPVLVPTMPPASEPALSCWALWAVTPTRSEPGRKKSWSYSWTLLSSRWTRVVHSKKGCPHENVLWILQGRRCSGYIINSPTCSGSWAGNHPNHRAPLSQAHINCVRGEGSLSKIQRCLQNQKKDWIRRVCYLFLKNITQVPVGLDLVLFYPVISEHGTNMQRTGPDGDTAVSSFRTSASTPPARPCWGGHCSAQQKAPEGRKWDGLPGPFLRGWRNHTVTPPGSAELVFINGRSKGWRSVSFL